jgi:hypothetical protein
MDNEKKLPEDNMKAVMGDLAWQNLTRYSKALPPPSFAVEAKHGEYVYRGIAYLVPDEEEAQPVRIVITPKNPGPEEAKQ